MAERTMQDRLNEEQVRELWTAWTTERRKVDRDRLVEHYMPLVKLLAAKMSRAVEPSSRPDMFGYASVGLLDAIDRFDPAIGVKFETFGSRRINGAMGDGLRAISYFPRGAENRASRVIEKIVPVDFQSAISEDGVRLDETISDPLDGEIDDLSMLASDHSEVVKALVHLPERERMVITQHYYLKKPLKEIGKMLGVTESRTCQLHRRALGMLQGVLTEKLSA